MTPTIHTATTNGAIRNSVGKLVAFYDADSKTLHIDGIAQEFHATNIVEAMEICGEKAPR